MSLIAASGRGRSGATTENNTRRRRGRLEGGIPPRRSCSGAWHHRRLGLVGRKLHLPPPAHPCRMRRQPPTSSLSTEFVFLHSNSSRNSGFLLRNSRKPGWWKESTWWPNSHGGIWGCPRSRRRPKNGFSLDGPAFSPLNQQHHQQRPPVFWPPTTGTVGGPSLW